ncbi:11177_t:CDS:2 [Dentiscutata erythropus]|uniref:11177_t:CDS:1 n=1 Tax=Dentiscutata erythropus TaxID=1348616 RepID=A0A9N9GHT2_9GLOM|nr:11177_t:CDS:2 [Dentiscutata erythropus]
MSKNVFILDLQRVSIFSYIQIALYIILLIDITMLYLLERTESGRYAPNQEEHYPSRLPSTRIEDSFSELSVLDSPPLPYPGFVEISNLFTTAPEGI